MELILANAEPVSLSGPCKTHKFVRHTEESEETVIVSTRTVHTLGTVVTEKLIKDMKSCGISIDLNVGQSLPKLKISIGLKELDHGTSQVYLEVDAAQFVSTTFGNSEIPDNDKKLELQLKNLKDTWNGSTLADEINFEPSNFNDLKTYGIVEKISHGGVNWNQTYWIRESSDWTASLTIKLTVPFVIGPDPDVEDRLIYSRRLLETEAFSDATIVAQNDAEIKFHRCILAAQSSVFATNFQWRMREGKTEPVEIDMCEKSLRAFRDYLYIWNIKVPQEDCNVCFELWKAGEMYDIGPLESCMKKILLRRDENWFKVDVALRLFIHVMDTDFSELKAKADKVMKTKFYELEELPAYQQLYKENLEAAKELCKCFAKNRK